MRLAEKRAFAFVSDLQSAVSSLPPHHEAGGEVAAFEEIVYGIDGEGSQRAVDLAVFGFVVGEEVVPGMVDDLPEWRGAGTPRPVDGG